MLYVLKHYVYYMGSKYYQMFFIYIKLLTVYCKNKNNATNNITNISKKKN